MKRSLLAVATLLALAAAVPALAAPSGSITVSPANGIAPYAAKVVWNVTGVTSCTASGSWTGTKATSGSQDITISAPADFALACASTTGSVLVAWTPPAARTDGTALTDLAGFNVYRGTDAASFARVKSLGPDVTSFTDAALPTGTYYYAVSAVDSASRESDLAKSAGMTIAGASWSQSAKAAVTAAPPPAPPTNVVTKEVLAYEYRPGTNTFAQIGYAPLGIPCGPETKVVGTVTYCRLDRARADLVVWPSDRKLADVWVRGG